MTPRSAGPGWWCSAPQLPIPRRRLPNALLTPERSLRHKPTRLPRRLTGRWTQRSSKELPASADARARPRTRCWAGGRSTPISAKGCIIPFCPPTNGSTGSISSGWTGSRRTPPRFATNCSPCCNRARPMRVPMSNRHPARPTTNGRCSTTRTTGAPSTCGARASATTPSARRCRKPSASSPRFPCAASPGVPRPSSFRC